MCSMLNKKGVLQVVLVNYEKRKIPQILNIRDSVERGAVLSEHDIKFLFEMYREVYQYKSFFENNTEYAELYIGFARIYCRIAYRALANEKRQ